MGNSVTGVFQVSLTRYVIRRTRDGSPMVQVLAFSGFSSTLPEKTALAWAAVGSVIRPIVPTGAPWATHTAIRSGLVIGPAQGSWARLVRPTTGGANISLMLGARTARL